MLCLIDVSLAFCTVTVGCAPVLELFQVKQVAGVSDFLSHVKRQFIGAAPEK